jgi:hypothetical protein
VNKEECWQLLRSAQVIHDEQTCEHFLRVLATQISNKLQESYPVVLAIMGGAVVFTGKLLPLLRFPLDFDYIHVSRYGKKLRGGTYFNWLKMPDENALKGRVVLILDDILDEGKTLLESKRKVLSLGAEACYTAVFADKKLSKKKPIKADFVALKVPDRYIFGYGMDVEGKWRNLGAIYALKEK